MYISIVIPTINEADNLRKLLPAFKEKLKQNGIKYEILIVDDMSNDGTPQVATSLGVKVLSRKKPDGVGGAVWEGARFSEGDAVVLMDADFSHPIESAIQLIRKMEDQSISPDIVKATRFVEGGGTESRYMTTALFNLVARIVMKLKGLKLSDVSGGFLIARRECFLYDQRFKDGRWILEFLFVNRHRKFAEMPYVYEKRVAGESKYANTKHLKRGIKYMIALLQLSLFS